MILELSHLLKFQIKKEMNCLFYRISPFHKSDHGHST